MLKILLPAEQAPHIFYTLLGRTKIDRAAHYRALVSRALSVEVD